MSIHHRRDFLRQMLGIGCSSLTLAPILSTITNLNVLNAIVSNSKTFNNTGEYKALVCIMLAGGNDSFNMLVPQDAERNLHPHYLQARGSMALKQDEIIDLNGYDNANHNGYEFGLHHKLSHIQSMFNSNNFGSNVSFIANVGTLTEKIENVNDYAIRSKPLGLFSHADQNEHWQTSIPQSRTDLGWAGRMIDIASSSNLNPYSHISLNGNNIFQRGNLLKEIAINPNDDFGSGYIWGTNNTLPYYTKRIETINSLMGETYSNILQKSYANTVSKANDYSYDFRNALSNVNPSLDLSGFTDLNSGISKQLKLVAKTIASKGGLNFNGQPLLNQTFYVNQSGYDTHDDMLPRHSSLMNDLDEALGAFNTALVSIEMQNKVTTFTTSDFARNLQSNGDGTDHGWGGHMLVMGGGIKGGQIFGSYPNLTTNNLDIGGGRFIPTTSCDEYFADLALWFTDDGSGANNNASLSYQNLKDILPNIRTFIPETLNQVSNDHRLGLFA